ncbi:MAG TPA: aminoacetone oxidase family FAD-binding enzyme [Gemmatimonadota bacterium]|nr:aminoacetone oxidase family FAD-binding enzyme [Gemmatimonadota bacterium]
MRESIDPVVVVGAGAAGTMAAIFAAEGARPVLLLERTPNGGRKIVISGGGRCNVLPSRAHPSQFVTASSPNTLKKMLLSWPLAEQRRFFEETLGIPLALEEETGKLFPVSNRSRDVRDALYGLARRRGVEIRFGARVTGLQPPVGDRPWRVSVEDEAPIPAAAVVLATGGLSVPASGSDGAGLRVAERLGHEIHPTYPALTPLTADPPRHAELAGVSLEARLDAPSPGGPFATQGGFLFTHRGYSGPAVLDISHLAVRSRLEEDGRQEIRVQWTDADAAEWDRRLIEGGGGTVGPLVRRHLPTRLADALVAEAGVDSARALAELRREERAALVETLARYRLPWTGDEGYRKAEVTGGGVALSEVDPRTMESRRRPGLHLCGEMLDAFGPIGGYNFLWGWATGRAAGRGVVGQVRTEDRPRA